jgi:cytochrome P450
MACALDSFAPIVLTAI